MTHTVMMTLSYSGPAEDKKFLNFHAKPFGYVVKQYNKEDGNELMGIF